MQGKGQLLVSTLLLFLFNVFAQNADNPPASFGSLEDDNDSDSSSWRESSTDPVDKRFNEFVGKRAEDDKDAHKRYEFIGKRAPSYEFIGKRAYEFLGKRNVYEFLGKRSPYEFLGKRSPYEFLGKRSPYEFLGKRSPYEFLGKRSPYEFLGKRSPYEFLGKRSPYEFLGKRSPYEFLGKRNPYEFLGKRSPYEFLGKRSPSYEFLGKRNPYEFLGKRNSSPDSHLPSLAKKRGMIDFYGKRVELPYEFVGKRSSNSEWAKVEGEGSVAGSPAGAKTGSHEDVNQSGAEDSSNKRYTEWLGKRGGAAQLPGGLFQPLTTQQVSSLLSDILRNGARPSHSRGHLGKGLTKRYTEFVGK